jgi:hypothetical protein
MRSPLPPTPPHPPHVPPPAGPHARWRSLARMLRARHARHARRQPIDAVLRRPLELFQPQAAHVSSHLALNCFVTLKVAPRAAAPTAATRVERRNAGGVAGVVMRERLTVVERPLSSVGRSGNTRASIASVSPLYSRRRADESRPVVATMRRAAVGGPAFGAFDGRDGNPSATRMSGSADMQSDARVFAAPRGLLRTEDAARTFGHLVRRLSRQETRVTPVASVAVARRSTEAPPGVPRTPVMSESTYSAPGIGMGATTAMQMQAAGDVNIEALASRVMQQIDRRLVAHRERMGRI